MLPALLEGQYSSLSAALEAAEEKEEEKGKEEKRGERAGGGKAQAAGAPARGAALSPSAARVLAEHGVSFVEVTEAGYAPALARAERARRVLVSGVEQALGGVAAARAVSAEQRAAVKAAVEYEKAKERLSAERSRVEELYRRKLREIEESYREALRKLEERYKELKSKGVARVKVGGRELSLEEWRKQAEKELARWREEALEKLRKWRQEAMHNLAKAEEELSRWLAGQEQRLSQWLYTTTAVLEKAAREAEKQRFKTLEKYEEWKRQVMEAAEKVKTRKEAEELAEKVYREAYRFWRDYGLSDADARRKAEEVKQEFLEKALAAAAEYQEKMREQLREKALEQLNKWLTGVLKEAVKASTLAEARRLADRVRREALRLLLAAGLSLDDARRLADQASQQVYEKAAESAKRWQRLREEADKIFNETVQQLKSMYQSLAKGRNLLRMEAAMDRVVEEAVSELREAARRLGLPESAVKPYIDRLRAYEQELVQRGLAYAEKFEELTRRAENLVEEYARQVLATGAPFENLDRYVEKLREELARLAPEAEKLGIKNFVQHYLQEFKAKVVNEARRRLSTLPPATWFCTPTAGGLYCDVYMAGNKVGGVTTRSTSREAMWDAMLQVGYRAAHVYFAPDMEKLEQMEMAYLRGENPREYMRRLGAKAFSWQGGLSLGSIYRNLSEAAEYVTEFYRLPAEKLAEKAEKEKGAKAAAEAALAGAASFGAGVISAGANIWNIPAAAQFLAETVATGGRNIVEAAKAAPLTTSVPFMAGQLVGGAALAESAIGAAKAASPTAGAALETALKLGAAYATTYGLVTGVRKALGKKPIPLPAMIGAAATAVLLKKAKGKVEEVNVTPEEAMKLVEAARRGEIETPVFELAGKEYEPVIVRNAMTGEETVTLVPRELVENPKLLTEYVEKLTGRKVSPVVEFEGTVAKVTVAPTEEEIAATTARLKEQLVASLERRELSERLRALSREYEELRRSLRGEAKQLEPEIEALQREVEEALYRVENEPMPAEAYRQLYEELRRYEQELARLKTLAKSKAAPTAEYRSVYETPYGEVTLEQVIKTLTKPEEETKTTPVEEVAVGTEKPPRPPRTVLEELPPPMETPVEMVAAAAQPPPKPPIAVAEEAPPPTSTAPAPTTPPPGGRELPPLLPLPPAATPPLPPPESITAPPQLKTEQPPKPVTPPMPTAATPQSLTEAPQVPETETPSIATPQPAVTTPTAPTIEATATTLPAIVITPAVATPTLTTPTTTTTPQLQEEETTPQEEETTEETETETRIPLTPGIGQLMAYGLTNYQQLLRMLMYRERLLYA